ncbi:hypothetical protein ACGFT2_33105 [Streptomyces sp. NPDC048514]|uniref:hypothetical protein n=1 Tax=Streptomyces sp. NPDC048514 TaxID=3365564 RepID=UPI00371F2118
MRTSPAGARRPRSFGWHRVPRRLLEIGPAVRAGLDDLLDAREYQDYRTAETDD